MLYNRLSFCLFVLAFWPIAIVVYFFEAVVNGCNGFFERFLNTLNQKFYIPDLSKNNYECKLKRFGINNERKD